MRIITISREFGSGGREIGKRMADNLGIAYFDKEIISAVAERSKLDVNYVEAVIDRGMFRDIPLSFGHSITNMDVITNTTQKVVSEHLKLLTEIAARGDCVIVGRNADVMLSERDPLKLFVYADTASKIARCRERAPEGEDLTDKELMKKMRRIDKSRARTHAFLSGIPWGAREGYHLCVNTSGQNIKSLAAVLSQYAEKWFEK